MLIKRIAATDIQFEKTAYTAALQESLLRIGCSFPLLVREDVHGFHCIDGHKRLSCLQDLRTAGVLEDKSQFVPVMIEHQTRSAPPASLRNHH